MIASTTVRSKALRSVLGVLRDPSSRPVFRALHPLRRQLVGVLSTGLLSATLEGARMASLLALLTSLTSSVQFTLPWLGALSVANAVALVLGLSVLREGVEWMRTYLAADCQRQFVDTLRTKTLQGILAQPYPWFTENQSGEAAFLVNAQVARFSTFLPVLSTAVSSGGTLLILGGILCWTDWRVAVTCGLGALLIGASSVLFNRMLVQYGFDLAEASTVAAARVQDALRAIKLVKVSRMEAWETMRCTELASTVTRLQLMATTTRQSATGLANLFGVAVLLSAVMIPGSHVLGTLLLAARALPEWSKVRDAWTQLASNLGFIVQVSPYLDVPIPEHQDDIVYGVELLHVNVQINETPILSDINLLVHRGMTVAIMGTTGSGKSTLLDVIAGLRPSDGVVRSGRCAYLTQDSPLLYGTVLENIQYGARRANIELTTLELNRHVGEGGCRVSGGQRQLIGLDRVCSQDHTVWLLDEPTANLDPRTEERVCEWLRSMRNHAILVATHRVAVADICHYVYVMQDGRIVEHGTPEDLRKRGGYYAALTRIQEVGA